MSNPTNHNDEYSLSFYLKEIVKIPLLTRDEENALTRAATEGSKDAKLKLIESNLRFVVNVAKKYQNQGLSLEDLVSEGNLGLMNAIDRFDPEKGYHLISYAVWWIRQAILKAISEKSRMIRLPMNRSNELALIEKTRKALVLERGESPSDAEISRLTGINSKDVTELQAISRDIISLESTIFDGSKRSTIGDYLEDLSHEAPENHAIMNSLSNDIENILETLNPKEADILRHRFGLGGLQACSLKDVGTRYGLTKERIRQIEKKALDRLRHPSRSKRLQDYIAA